MSTVLRHVATDSTDISTENDMSHHVMHAVRIRSEMELSNMPGNTTRVTLRVDKVSTGFFFPSDVSFMPMYNLHLQLRFRLLRPLRLYSVPLER